MKTIFAVSALLVTLGPAAADDAATGHKPLSGVYKIYGGGLADQTKPTDNDKKVMFSITGPAARDLFEQIGPDKRDECTAGQGIRVRSRDSENLFCMRSAEGGYRCNFGFDLQSGKSIGGIVC